MQTLVDTNVLLGLLPIVGDIQSSFDAMIQSAVVR